MNKSVTSRHEWDLRLTERPTADAWVRGACLVLLGFLLLNTKNPLANWLTISAAQVEETGDLNLFWREVLGAGVYVAFFIGACWFIGGRHDLGTLFQRLRWRDIGITLGYGLLYFALVLVAGMAALFLPASWELASTPASALAWLSGGAALATFLQGWLYALANQVVVVFVWLGFNQAMQRRSPTHAVAWRRVGMIVAAIVAGLLALTAAEPQPARAFLVAFCGELPLLLAYRRSRNVLIPAVIVAVIHILVV